MKELDMSGKVSHREKSISLKEEVVCYTKDSLKENISHCFEQYPIMKEKIEELQSENTELKKKIKELEAKIASLRCCGNCKNKESVGESNPCNHCNEWNNWEAKT